VFVSYHHGGDQAYHDAFYRTFCDTLDVFTDRSLDRARDSNNPEYIMRDIREHHRTGASTLIVLCGLETPYRKFVDWELHAALKQDMALLGVKLPHVPVVQDGCSTHSACKTISVARTPPGFGGRTSRQAPPASAAGSRRRTAETRIVLITRGNGDYEMASGNGVSY
jgi:hypothetical protein